MRAGAAIPFTAYPGNVGPAIFGNTNGTPTTANALVPYFPNISNPITFPSPIPSGTLLSVFCQNTNTSGTVTLALNGGPALSVRYRGLTPIPIGSIAGQHWNFFMFTGSVWELIAPTPGLVQEHIVFLNNLLLGSGQATVDSLIANVTGNNNTAVGTSSLQAITTGTSNVAMGFQALNTITTAVGNVGVGQQAGVGILTSSGHTVVGHLAGRNNGTSANQTVFGYQAVSNVNNTGSANCVFGYQACASGILTGANNCVFGPNAGLVLGSGSNNCLYGSAAGGALSTGGSNAFFGTNAGNVVTTGTINIAVGNNAGASFTATGSNQIDIGGAFLRDTTDNITVQATTTKINSGRLKKFSIKTANYTLVAADHHIVCDSATAFTLTLPAATGSGREFIITNVNTGAITVDANAAETINGALTVVLPINTSISIMDYAAGKWLIT
jgi:hypothetical protein